MHESSVRQCGRCCFSRRIAGRLYCIRNPPTTDPATGRARWPHVRPTDRCGCFCPKLPSNVIASPSAHLGTGCAKQSQSEISLAATAAATPNQKSEIVNHKYEAALPVFVDPFGEYCKIPLTQGRFAKVDPRSYPWLAQFRWCVKVNVDNCYAVRTVQVRGKSKRIYMHRQIMNTPADRVCDHINHDGLDNRRDNLRNCTTAENNAHRRKRLPRPRPRAPALRDTNHEIRDTASRATDHSPRPPALRDTNNEIRDTASPPTTSQYLGVSRDKRTGKWVAHIKKHGRPRYLGSFAVEEHAARAYDEAARILHGEFAMLNFPDARDK